MRAVAGAPLCTIVHGGLVAKVVQCCKMINMKGLEIFGDVLPE